MSNKTCAAGNKTDAGLISSRSARKRSQGASLANSRFQIWTKREQVRPWADHVRRMDRRVRHEQTCSYRWLTWGMWPEGVHSRRLSQGEREPGEQLTFTTFRKKEETDENIRKSRRAVGKREKGSEGSLGYMGSRVCGCENLCVRMCVWCHMFLNRIHVAHTAAFYLSKHALITHLNPVMPFHIKQMWLKWDKYERQVTKPKEILNNQEKSQIILW